MKERPILFSKITGLQGHTEASVAGPKGNASNLAVPAPVNAAPIDDKPVADSGHAASQKSDVRLPAQSVAAPVHGIDGRGRHYLIERNPKWPMIEFRMRLKYPNTLTD